MTLKRTSKVWEVWQGQSLVCSSGMRLTERQAKNKVENERRWGRIMEARPSKVADVPDRSARVKWLRANPDVLKLSRRGLVMRMKLVGIMSVKTYQEDVNLWNLLRDAGYGRRQAAKFSLCPSLHGETRR